MFKGITPTFTLTLPNTVDLSSAQNVYATFSDRDEKPIIRKTGADLSVDENVVEIYLTQEETLSLPAGTVLIQLNWTYDESGVTKRACSEIISVQFANNLENEVLA